MPVGRRPKTWTQPRKHLRRQRRRLESIRSPPPLPKAQLGKKDKIKAMDEARAKARASDAQDMMKQLSDVYEDAATAKLASHAAGDSTGTTFDYKHISTLFGGAAGDEKKVDTPNIRGKPEDKVEATPEDRDDSASDDLALMQWRAASRSFLTCS